MYYSVINGPELMELQNDSTVNVQAIKRTLMMVPMQNKKQKKKTLDWAVLQDVTTVDSALIEVTRRLKVLYRTRQTNIPHTASCRCKLIYYQKK